MINKKQIALERQTINDAIRLFFKERGYIEVETPLLVASPGMEPNLCPFETTVYEPNRTAHPATLATSPEYSLKKLLGMGMQKVYSLGKSFRNEEEFGGTHNHEFTMLEWYQQEADYQACMDETEELVKFVSERVTLPLAKGEVWRGSHKDASWSRIRIHDLFLKHLNLDLDTADAESMKTACHEHEIHFTPDDTLSDLYYRLFLAKIEPSLGTDPIFVYDYPLHQAAMSQLTADGKYGQRFELYINGLELCNGYTELTDSVEQRHRFEIEAEERRALGKTVHPIDEALLTLLPSVQIPTYGNALGVDRLHMILVNRSRIEDVLLFSVKDLFN